MADFQLRGIEAAIVEKVKTIARERQMQINDVMLMLLRQSLGLAKADPIADPPRAQSAVADGADTAAKAPGEVPAGLPGGFGQDESAALLEAIKAFENLPEDRSPFRLAGRERV